MWDVISVNQRSVCERVCVQYASANAHAYCASASSCPAAYKLSAAITEEGPHCVKDKSAVCHQWEITVIYEGLSQQRQVNMHFRAPSEIPPPFCILKEKDVGTARDTHLNIGCCETISATDKPSLCFRMFGADIRKFRRWMQKWRKWGREWANNQAFMS